MGGVPLRPGTFLLLLAVSLVGAGAGAALVLMGESGGAALAVALAGGAVATAHGGARGTPRLELLAAVAERLLDAVVLGAIAWIALPERIGIAIAAIAALGTSYLAVYLRVRASGLGFHVVEPPLFRVARPLLVAVGLLAGLVEVALWTVTAISVVVLAMEIVELGRQRAPR
jgi:hypothetical protein